MTEEAYERTRNGAGHIGGDNRGGGRSIKSACVGCGAAILYLARYCRDCRDERAALREPQSPLPWGFRAMLIIGFAALLMLLYGIVHVWRSYGNPRPEKRDRVGGSQVANAASKHPVGSKAWEPRFKDAAPVGAN